MAGANKVGQGGAEQEEENYKREKNGLICSDNLD